MEVYSILDIPEQGITLNKPLHIDWLDANLNHGVERKELTVTAVADGQTTLELRKIDPEGSGDPVVRVKGTVEAKIMAHCVRCLEHVLVDVQNAVDHTLFPSANKAVPSPRSKSKDDDAELITELTDLDEDTYTGQKIDLPSIVRESILLGLDMNTTCGEQNQCETRTQALIQGASLEAEEQKIDPRWAALKKFQLKTE